MNFGSWKTTGAGIIAFMIGMGMIGKVINDFFLGNPITYEEIALAVGTITGGLTGIFARDNNVSSEQAKAGIISPNE